MKKTLLVLAASFVLLSCSGNRSSQPTTQAVSVLASSDCFHNWVSDQNNDEPTGECVEAGTPGTKHLFSSIEVDYPTRALYIHGDLYNPDGASTWFRFNVTSCKDTADGWTVVNGVNPTTGEMYELKHHEIKEIPATGQAKQAFQGEAALSVQLSGQSYHTHLSCTRYVF